MNWDLLAIVPPIFLVLGILVFLWGARTMWKSDNKFIAFICFVIAVALCILGYAMYGNKLFQ